MIKWLYEKQISILSFHVRKRRSCFSMAETARGAFDGQHRSLSIMEIRTPSHAAVSASSHCEFFFTFTVLQFLLLSLPNLVSQTESKFKSCMLLFFCLLICFQPGGPLPLRPGPISIVCLCSIHTTHFTFHSFGFGIYLFFLFFYCCNCMRTTCLCKCL